MSSKIHCSPVNRRFWLLGGEPILSARSLLPLPSAVIADAPVKVRLIVSPRMNQGQASLWGQLHHQFSSAHTASYGSNCQCIPIHPGINPCGCVPLFPRDLAAYLHSLIYYGGYAIPALHSEQTNFRRRQQLSFSISSACFCDFLFYLFYRKPKLCATRKKWQFKMQANACSEKVCFIISVKMLLFPHTDLKKPTFKKRTENLSQKARQYSAEFLANMAKSSTLFFCGVQKKTKKK